MKKYIKNMQVEKQEKKAAETKVRTTISISSDFHPDHSEAVRDRMKELRRPSFSNFVENLIADDVKAAALQEAAA